MENRRTEQDNGSKFKLTFIHCFSIISRATKRNAQREIQKNTFRASLIERGVEFHNQNCNAKQSRENKCLNKDFPGIQDSN